MALTKGVHQVLAGFRWLAEYLSRRPARLYELVTLQSTMNGYYDASGYMCIGAVLLGPTAVPWATHHNPSPVATSPESAGADPIIWQAHFPADITYQLVPWGNPEVQVANSDLDLAVIVIHRTCMANFFDISERTTLYQTGSTAGLW